MGMPRVSVKYNGTNDPVRWFRAKRDRIENGNQEVIEKTMDEAAELMRFNILTRGIAPKSGRVDTRYMLDQVESSTTVSGKGNVQGRFGWLRGVESYFLYQEGGFRHYGTGQLVPAMYAQSDAAEWAMNELQKRIREIIQNA